MLFWHSMSITQQVMSIYNTNVHKNNTNVVLNFDKELEFSKVKGVYSKTNKGTDSLYFSHTA